MSVLSDIISDSAKWSADIARTTGVIDQTCRYRLAPDVWCTVIADMGHLRMFAHDSIPLYSEDDESLTFYLPGGKVVVTQDRSTPDGTWGRRAELDMGNLIGNIARSGSTYFKRNRMPRHQPCAYCGAPGQTVGSRCEYCQVAVSR